MLHAACRPYGEGAPVRRAERSPEGHWFTLILKLYSNAQLHHPQYSGLLAHFGIGNKVPVK